MFIEQNQGVVRRGLEGVEVLLTYKSFIGETPENSQRNSFSIPHLGKLVP